MASPKPDKTSDNHRQRMRERVITHGAETLADYELVEMLLYHSIPRQDTKPLAKELLKKFKSLQGVLHSGYDELIAIDKVGSQTAMMMTLIREVSRRISAEEAFNKGAILQSWTEVINYCREELGRRPTEAFMALYLDATNRLITKNVFEAGTVNKVAVYPREIVKSALKSNAVAVILVHNHPSGDTSPSKQDIALTKTIKDALMTLDITLHDHIIISASDHDSFKQLGLL